MKRTLAIVVALLMVMTLIPVTAGAQKVAAFRSAKADLDMTAVASGKTLATRDDPIFVDGSLVSCGFESTEDCFNNGWTRIDNDGDGYWWYNDTSSGASYCNSGTGMVFSYSYYSGTVLNSDNWMLTPAFEVPAQGGTISLYAMSINANYLDHFQVLIGEDGEAYDAGTLYADAWTTLIASTEAPNAYTQYTASIPASMAGKTVYVAIRHQDSDQLALMVDDVSIGQIGEMVVETGVTVNYVDENDQTQTINSYAMNVTETVQFNAVVEPSNASYTDVTWTSSDTSVAIVNNVGGVMAMGAGTANITVTTHNGVTNTVAVTVSEGNYTFVTDNLLVYGVYDADNSAYVNTYYQVDQFGACADVVATDEVVEASAWSEVDEVIYAYVQNGDNMDFVSYDPFNDFAKTVITANVDAPYWMAYGFDTEEMYGAFAVADSDGYITNFYLAKIDVATGAMGDILVDTYATQDYSGNQYFLPFFGTYIGDGMFAGADVNYGDLLLYAPNFEYNGENIGFVVFNAGEYSTTEMYGGAPDTYYQSMYFNPFDGMLYWACNDEAGLHMTVVDLSTGIAVNTGNIVNGDNARLITTSMFYVYLLADTYTVSFYDSITGELIAEVEVEEGGAAEAPAAPEHEGYTFVGWDADFSNVTADMDVYTIYEENAQPGGLLGDVDCDGEVTFSDISLLAQYLAGAATLTPQGILNADMDQNGEPTFADVGAIYQFLVG